MIRAILIIFIAIFSLAITSPAVTTQARTPQELCFTSWQWYEDGGGEWDSPWIENTLGRIDLRTIPQMSKRGPIPEGRAIFVLDTADLCKDSGMPLSPNLDAILGPLESLLLEEQLNLPLGSLTGLTTREMLWRLHTTHADIDGISATRPIEGTERVSRALKVGGYGTIKEETRITINSLTAPIKQITSILKPLFLTVTDNFNRPNESLDAGNWTEVVGDWSVTSNEAEYLTATTAQGKARYEADLDTTNHYAQVNVTSLPDTALTGWQLGVVARFSASADTGYAVNVDNVGDTIRAFKTVAGVRTNLDSDKAAETPTVPGLIRIEVDGSNIKTYHKGVLKHDFTDTSITTNLRTGLHGREKEVGTASTVDNFEAADLGVVATPQRIIIIKDIGRKQINRLDQIFEGVEMLIAGEIERFMNTQKILQEHAIKTFIDHTPLTPGEQIAHYELTPSYFILGRKYGLKDNELARAILRPAFIIGL